MLQKLNNKGFFAGSTVLALIAVAGVHYYVTTGKNIFKAKEKTVDTVENPATPQVPYSVNNFK